MATSSSASTSASQGMQKVTRRGADCRQSGPGAGSSCNRPLETGRRSTPSTTSASPSTSKSSEAGPFDGGTLFTKHPIDGPAQDDHPPSCSPRTSSSCATLNAVKSAVDSEKARELPPGRLDDLIAQSILEAQEEMVREEQANGLVGVVEYSEESLILSTAEKVRVKVAMDSGAVANVIHPKQLPSDATPEPNTNGKHFNGAGGDFIERFGTCMTELEGEHGSVGCDWDLADVSRALHSVSKVAGPYEGPGKQDIVFNNKRCVVVPPGVLDAIMKHVKAVAEYKREGDLYVAEMTMSSFQRQEPKA